MNRVKVFGRQGSAYKRQINDWMGGHRIQDSHLAVNYGLQGERLDNYIRRYPGIERIPILNKRQAGSKFDQIQAVIAGGEVAPMSWRTRVPADDINAGNEIGRAYIVKPYYSLGGRDIREWDGNPAPNTHYIQERIKKRRYEIRVHAFAWVDPLEWVFQKRVHDDGENVLAWNHHNGGRFITIEDPHDPLHNRIRESVKHIMKILGYQFGGADFIIQNPGERGAPLIHHFIEWNLAPGWTLENTADYYRRSFLMLNDIDMDTVQAMTGEGLYPWEMEPAPAERGVGVDVGDLIHRQAQARINHNNEIRRMIDEALVVDEREPGMAPGDEIQWREWRNVPMFRQDHLPIEDGVMQEEPVDPVNEHVVDVGMVEMDLAEAERRVAEDFGIQFCPRCGQAQAPMAHMQELNFCFSCGLEFNGNNAAAGGE